MHQNHPDLQTGLLLITSFMGFNKNRNGQLIKPLVESTQM